MARVNFRPRAPILVVQYGNNLPAVVKLDPETRLRSVGGRIPDAILQLEWKKQLRAQSVYGEDETHLFPKQCFKLVLLPSSGCVVCLLKAIQPL